MNVEAAFVRSAASADDLPRDGLAELAMVGRSNVGKSSLINALVRQRVARTSAAPGKTRLANVYRVARATAAPFYLVDLPGFGFARGDAGELATVVGAYFGRVRLKADSTYNADRDVRSVRLQDRDFGALLLVDARHPGLANDLEAWRWLTTTVGRCDIVATKIDKLSRAERLRALKANEAAFEHPVWPVSAHTGEGLDELWKLIEQLLKPSPSNRRRSPPPLPLQRS